MLRNRPVILRVSNTNDFVLPVGLLNLLLVIAALISPYPVVLTLAVIVFASIGWRASILEFSKSNNVKLTLVIFPDGRVRLESDQVDTIEGFLDGQQWSTSWFAVLRVVDGDRVRKLLIRSSHQQAKDDFRRLNMWLRQGLNISTRVKQVLDN